ncbi:MAG: C4-type zinc ribbon domain-containing protein [candidate division WOR-3 bacterium]
MNPKIETLRSLEEFDLILRDIESESYQQVGFKGVKASEQFIKIAEKERAKLTKKIDPKVLAQYERIMKRYGGRVVVQVIREFCGGCYVRLPSELAVRCRTELVTCPNCGRFLYWVK